MPFAMLMIIFILTLLTSPETFLLNFIFAQLNHEIMALLLPTPPPQKKNQQNMQ